MARDFLHTAEIVDAVIAVLKGADGAAHTNGLPANWFPDARDSLETPLFVLEHGDLSDYAAVNFDTDLPAILVRGRGLRPYPQNPCGPVQWTTEFVRVVLIRAYDQCHKADGTLWRNQTRAREAYAKTLGKALFADPKGILAVIDAQGQRTIPTLTCADSNGTQIQEVRWAGWDLGLEYEGEGATQDVASVQDLGLPIWAIACDLAVDIMTGG
jgi:hypothetical protein